MTGLAVRQGEGVARGARYALAGLIRVKRVYLGWSQRRLAEEAGAGLTLQRVFRLEKALVEPRPRELAGLAEALDLPVLADLADHLARRDGGGERAQPGVPDAAVAGPEAGPEIRR